MVINKSKHYGILLTILLCFITIFSFAQKNAEKQVSVVFNQLLSVYGSAKTTPKLVFIKKVNSPVLPARYNSEASSIEIDIALYELCRGFGKDSLNAISIVLSHELTHYYNDHLFCSDYAWVNLKNSNLNLARKIRDVSLSSRKEKEIEADIKGFFFALAGGFKIQGLHEKLIKAIYKKYNLADKEVGYPTKLERIKLALSAENEAATLYGYFEKGLIYLSQKKYEQAKESFEYANSKIPFKENFNNIGVAKMLRAISLMTFPQSELDLPDRFQYPFEIDYNSDLRNAITRGLDDNSEEVEKLLLSSVKDFESAIRLDPQYLLSHVNLASNFDLLGKHFSAISQLTEKIPMKFKESTNVKRVLAIAYYHSGFVQKSNLIWDGLNL
jgi:tetratricopeptide (TPR) repeat protein